MLRQMGMRADIGTPRGEFSTHISVAAGEVRFSRRKYPRPASFAKDTAKECPKKFAFLYGPRLRDTDLKDSLPLIPASRTDCPCPLAVNIRDPTENFLSDETHLCA